jgi:hypothetical protein
MADEPQSTEPEQTEQAEPNPAIAYQPAASVISVYDSDGREHFTAATSKFVVDGLADGTLTEQPANSQGTPSEPQTGSSSTEEVPSGSEAGSASDDPQPGSSDGGPGSGDGSPETGSARRGRRAGQA